MTLSPARTAQEAIQRRLDDLVGSGVELGAQVAAYVGDELVVHAWAGVADPATGRPVDGNTLFPVFSVSKGIIATAVHRLVERDVLRYDTGLDSIVPRRVAPAGRSWAMDAFLPFGATMTARAGAALYGALASGGGRLLSPERVAIATRIRRRDTDQIIGAPALKSLGYLHADPVSGGVESAFGFGGLGGAEAYADPERRLGFAFTHNRLTPPTAAESAPGLAALLRENLGVA